MAKAFKTAAAFRASLEARLAAMAATRGVPVNSLRLKLTMERLLARVFSSDGAPWLLKGGYAMELRYRPRFRATKDLDLSMSRAASAADTSLAAVRDTLQRLAEVELGDYFVFEIAAARIELQGAPQGGGRFPVVARLAGRVFARFHVDVGIGDVEVGAPEELAGEDFLAFAGVAPAIVQAISRPQQFAEKIHAYTYPWEDRSNTRTKDLLDLFLLTTDTPDAGVWRAALTATFTRRQTHDPPVQLPVPPDEWRRPFADLASEASLSVSLQQAFQAVQKLWRSLSPPFAT
jgi:hypothetical protein